MASGDGPLNLFQNIFFTFNFLEIGYDYMSCEPFEEETLTLEQNTKYIPHGCRLAFSQALKTVLYKEVAQPDSVQIVTFSMMHASDGSGLESLGEGGGDFLEESTTGNTNIKQCLPKVTDGHFTSAVKVLSSSGVAPYCDDTVKALEAKHPYKLPPSMSSNKFSKLPLVA
ncbi:hypothetical protein CTI12_AA122990 [Artemisia annua]|uniref:Uncharacterized protein n=1 Tax=Artemisia annua TaxID=35608 RepID=A0A2U1NIM8_ARTAN|nr:hypothetical protein CTI12_AA122990 [Artemisia annua]